MSSVGAENDIALGEVSADARGDRFLPHVCVASTVDQSALMRSRQLKLGLADDDHRSIQSNEDVSVEANRWSGGHGQASQEVRFQVVRTIL